MNNGYVEMSWGLKKRLKAALNFIDVIAKFHNSMLFVFNLLQFMNFHRKAIKEINQMKEVRNFVKILTLVVKFVLFFASLIIYF